MRGWAFLSLFTAKVYICVRGPATSGLLRDQLLRACLHQGTFLTHDFYHAEAPPCPQTSLPTTRFSAPLYGKAPENTSCHFSVFPFSSGVSCLAPTSPQQPCGACSDRDLTDVAQRPKVKVQSFSWLASSFGNPSLAASDDLSFPFLSRKVLCPLCPFLPGPFYGPVLPSS